VTPVAAHAALDGDALTMHAIVVSEDGRRVVRERGSAAPVDAEALGRKLADGLLGQGAAAMVELHPRDR
jgi:hydroxymethylbilane synthase